MASQPSLLPGNPSKSLPANAETGVCHRDLNTFEFWVDDVFKGGTLAVQANGLVLPDWVYLVETDASPFALWILKGDGVPAKEGPHELRPGAD